MWLLIVMINEPSLLVLCHVPCVLNHERASTVGFGGAEVTSGCSTCGAAWQEDWGPGQAGPGGLLGSKASQPQPGMRRHDARMNEA